jgi:hypothetical protein
MPTNGGNPLYDQLEAQHENVALQVEQLNEAFNVSISFIDWDALKPEERDYIHLLHRSVICAAEAIRTPDSLEDQE